MPPDKIRPLAHKDSPVHLTQDVYFALVTRTRALGLNERVGINVGGRVVVEAGGRGDRGDDEVVPLLVAELLADEEVIGREGLAEVRVRERLSSPMSHPQTERRAEKTLLP